jgi:hypothetical protein
VSYTVTEDADVLRIVFRPPRRFQFLHVFNLVWTSVGVLGLMMLATRRGLTGNGWLLVALLGSFAALSVSAAMAREFVTVDGQSVSIRRAYRSDGRPLFVIPLDGRRFVVHSRPGFWSFRPGAATVGLADGGREFGVGGRLTDGAAESLAAVLNAYLDRAELLSNQGIEQNASG